MDAKELRLGNLVYVVDKEANPQKTITEVTLTWLAIPEAIEPIPLTPKLLDSCLYYDGSEWYLGYETAWSIQQYGGRFGLAYAGDISKETWVDHLHQLQNLYFALTGEELEIEL